MYRCSSCTKMYDHVSRCAIIYSDDPDVNRCISHVNSINDLTTFYMVQSHYVCMGNSTKRLLDHMCECSSSVCHTRALRCQALVVWQAWLFVACVRVFKLVHPSTPCCRLCIVVSRACPSYAFVASCRPIRISLPFVLSFGCARDSVSITPIHPTQPSRRHRHPIAYLTRIVRSYR